jgi:F0F1-type ATP synthase delta subunit
MMAIPEDGFINPEQLAGWLKSQPVGSIAPFAQVIAHRAALRVLPKIAAAFHERTKDHRSVANMTIAVFRANAIARVALDHPTHEIDNAASAAAVAAAATDISGRVQRLIAVDAAFAAAFAAFTASFAVTARFNVENFGPNVASHTVDDGADSAADSASKTARSASDSATWRALSSDVRTLERTGASLSMRRSPLWPKGVPETWSEQVAALETALSTAPDRNGAPGGEGWSIWLEWFICVAERRRLFGLPHNISEKLELRIALGDWRDGFWDRDAADINAEIARWVSEARSVARSLSNQQLRIPKTAPSSVRPEWTNGRLRNRRGVGAFISSEAQAAALSAHRDELLTLARKTKGKNSVETEARALISDTARLISSSGQVSRKGLFRLGIKLEILMEYSETVNRDWPDALARSYKGNILGLDKTLDQFKELVEFRRNSAEAELDSAHASLDAQSVKQVAEALGSAESTKFVDKGLISDIEASAELLASEAVRSGGEVTPRAQHDALEGANNLFKELAIKAQQGGPAEAGQAAYKEGFASKYIKASRQAGEQDAEKAAAWANRTLLSSEMLGAAARHLAHRYPKSMGWLNKIWGDDDHAAAGRVIEHQPNAGKADDAPH